MKGIKMENCDLPPTLKVFPGSGNKMVLPSEDEKNELRQIYSKSGFDDNDKLQILKALHLSQTRAREAEERAAALVKERDTISNALLEESKRLFTYCQSVRLLKLQVSKLQRQQRKNHFCYSSRNYHKGDDNEGRSGLLRIVAITLCFWITAIGFAFGFSTFSDYNSFKNGLS